MAAVSMRRGHYHPHSRETHHIESCDAACRRGRRLHFHRTTMEEYFGGDR